MNECEHCWKLRPLYPLEKDQLHKIKEAVEVYVCLACGREMMRVFPTTQRLDKE